MNHTENDAILESVQLHAIRLKLKTDKEIADYLGVSPQVYCRRQQRAFWDITVAEFARMADALEFTAEDLEKIFVRDERRNGSEV